MFFYGLEPGDEVSVDIERGKTLIVRFVAVSDGHEDGTRTVFFELNGQPRSVKVPDRSQVALKPPRRKADPANANHVGAPMPGTVATVPVSQGGRVTRGDVLRDDRSDEDGDDRARRPRRDRRGSRDASGRADRCEGSAGGAGVGRALARQESG